MLDKERKHLIALKELTGESILEDAKKPSSPIHKLFDWNDKRVAEQARILQAARLARSARAARYEQAGIELAELAKKFGLDKEQNWGIARKISGIQSSLKCGSKI